MHKIIIAVVLISLSLFGAWGVHRTWHSFVIKTEPNVIILQAPPPLIYPPQVYVQVSKEARPQRIGSFIGQPGWSYFCLAVDGVHRVIVGRADCTTQEKFNRFTKSLEEKNGKH